MTRVASGKIWPAAAALTGVLWVSACAANQPADTSAAARPGSYQAIMAVKMPGLYGPHLPAADAAAATQAPVAVPGSALSILAAKSPAVYGPHLPAADAAQGAVVASSCQPGSFAALMSAKLPPSARPGSPELYRDCR